MYRYSLVTSGIIKRGLSQIFNGNARVWQDCRVPNSLLRKPRNFILKTFYSEDGRYKPPIINYNIKKKQFNVKRTLDVKLQSFDLDRFEKDVTLPAASAKRLTAHNQLLKQTMAQTRTSGAVVHDRVSDDLKRLEIADADLIAKATNELGYEKTIKTVHSDTPTQIVVNDRMGDEASVTKPPTTIVDNVFETELAAERAKMGQQQTESARKSWQTMKYSLIALGVSCAASLSYLLHMFGGPKRDDEGREIVDEFSNLPFLEQYYYRMKHECTQYNKMIKEPSRAKLLPDPLQPPYFQPPYTLVVEFTDVLVHPEWTYNTGWRFKKRPGVDKFLEMLYTRFEVVVYTAELGMTVFPILEALDVNNYITYKLVRDATNFVGGHHVKDLDKLNRDLSKVIVVDWNPDSNNLHQENLFKIPKWDGKDDDTTLYDLTAFLVAISEWEVDDVRAVLEHYSQFDRPLAKFKQRQMQILSETN